MLIKLSISNLIQTHLHSTMLLVLLTTTIVTKSMPTTSVDTSSTSSLSLNNFHQLNEFQTIGGKPLGQYQFTRQKDPFMQLYKISSTKTTENSSDSNNNITCNDGSPIGYYKRLNKHSKSWIIFLQGGGFCSSEESCRLRWQQSPHLMSSNFWPKTKLGK